MDVAVACAMCRGGDEFRLDPRVQFLAGLQPGLPVLVLSLDPANREWACNVFGDIFWSGPLDTALGHCCRTALERRIFRETVPRFHVLFSAAVIRPPHTVAVGGMAGTVEDRDQLGRGIFHDLSLCSNTVPVLRPRGGWSDGVDRNSGHGSPRRVFELGGDERSVLRCSDCPR